MINGHISGSWISVHPAMCPLITRRTGAGRRPSRQSHFGPHRALGIYIGLGSIGAVLSPTVVGALLDAACSPLSGFRSAFALAAGLTLLGAVTAAR